jgi:hypothetical protein
LARNFGPGGSLGKCYGNAMEMLWKCYEHLGNAMENGHFNGKLIEVPSGKPTKKRWKITMFNGYINYINYKWSFSIATLNYQS